MKNQQKKLTPALEKELEKLKDVLVNQAKLVGNNSVENAQKIELLCSILQEAGIVASEEELMGFTDLRTAASALDMLIESKKADNRFSNSHSHFQNRPS